MRRRIGAVGTLIAIAAIVPLADTAHAQDLDCINFTYQEDAQAEYNRDPSDPHGLDEDQGRDDGIACEVLPRRGTAVSTVRPATPAAPTLGVRGGLGGAADSGFSGWETAAGIAFVAGGAVAVGYVVKRRRT
ncbi:excalibur calcium-binding protein [Streptomyces cupreus]|uniref:Excalibur calcium-binding protein n=1 Tax=Streptomyces cupreus TaxID=2759956 RepID=A0A7X1J6V0_9ACTN|nr:excalibur calcium-binding protein [Streptomyces cupreus]MBC2902742.1 excalibur calcium-binding protein [Streptomyces cupreus]